LRIRAAEVESISDSSIAKVTVMAQQPFFNGEVMRTKSSAASCLVEWVLSVLRYKSILNMISSTSETSPEAPTSVTKLRKNKAEERKSEFDSEQTLHNALVQLGNLDKASIVEIKAYAKPPDMVIKTVAAVMTILDKEPTWAVGKAVLSDPRFLQQLRDFNADNISTDTLDKLERYTNDPNFTPETVRKVSCAAATLCQWVHAVKIHRDQNTSSPCTTALSSQPSPRSEHASSMASSPPLSPTGSEPEPDSPRALVGKQLEAALHALTKSDLQELKALAKPPSVVLLVCEAVMHLQAGINTDIMVFINGVSWKTIQKLMNNPQNFLRNLQSVKLCIDSGMMPRANVEAAERLTHQTSDNFSPIVLMKQSKAVAGLCAWISSVIEYYNTVTAKEPSSTC